MGKIRIHGLRKNYKFKEWLEESLRKDDPPLDYFSFAQAYDNTESLTNTQYSDILDNLSNNQSNKLTAIALDANDRFKKRNGNVSFGIAYRKYWKERNQQKSKQAVAQQQQKAVVKMNNIICENLVSLTEQMNDARGVSGSVSDVGSHPEEGSDVDSHPDEGSDYPQDSHQEDHIDTILKCSSESYADSVGCMGIIDLTAENVVNMLKEADEYEDIMNASALSNTVLSNHAQEILNTFRNTTPSAKSIRTVLRTYGNPIDFDIFEHADFGFIEVTTRHFLDLIESPRNPLLRTLQERTTAIHTTTFLLNQLFLSYNDMLELDWIEKEHCSTKKRKWDGILVSINNKKVSLSLVEFSGGIKVNNSNTKEQHDISKLYENMVKILEILPEASKKQVFAVRFFNNNIYFEKLLYHESKYIRSQHAHINCPVTPRSLLQYIQEVPNLMGWRDAVINHSLQF